MSSAPTFHFYTRSPLYRFHQRQLPRGDGMQTYLSTSLVINYPINKSVPPAPNPQKVLTPLATLLTPAHP
jgi:hypothetical protein